MSVLLPSWNDGPARRAIVEFVDNVVSAVQADERVAVFDNDGTLWCEKPMPIQLDFILRRLVGMAEAQADLRERQPWQAAYERDYGWFGRLMAEHYLDDGAQKPIRIWSRIGRRPILAAGNSNGDIPMLDFSRHQDKPFLRLLLLHDDGAREFDYTSGAEQAIAKADTDGWTVVSVKHDWATVFSGDLAV